MTDVLLVNPRSFSRRLSYLPYGILYIAGFLRSKGFAVEIYDSNVEDRDLQDVLMKSNPKIIGFSVLSGPCISDAVKKSQLVKDVVKDTFIVWGGIHTTIFPDHVLKQPYVDYIVMNEGEQPMAELCERLLNNNLEMSDILNVGYKKNGKIIKNKLRPFIDLNEIPFPAWDLVPMERYIHNKFYSNRVTTLHTSRGCPWSCSYCYNESVNFRKWRGMSAEKVLAQVLHVKEKYGIKGIQFDDDEFDANPQRVIEFSNLLLEKNVRIKWSHFSRTNVANEERYKLAKKAGCRFVEFGVESGSERILQLIRKGQDVNCIKNAFDICHKVGLKAGAMFMVGMPTETKEDVDKTVSMVASLKAHQVINSVYRPYPGSKLFDSCVQSGQFKLPDDLEEQGKVFNIGSTDINVSNVDTEYLQSIHDMFTLNNIINAVKSSLVNRNWEMLGYYMQRLDFITIKTVLNGMPAWVKGRRFLRT